MNTSKKTRKELSNELLNYALYILVYHHRSNNKYFKVIYHMLFTTGCMLSELYDISKWRINSRSIVSFLSEKSAFPRVFDNVYIPKEYIDIISDNSKIKELPTHQQVIAHFKQHFLYTGVKIANENFSISLFRINYIKVLHEAEKPPEFISQMLHAFDVDEINAFVNAKITYQSIREINFKCKIK